MTVAVSSTPMPACARGARDWETWRWCKPRALSLRTPSLCLCFSPPLSLVAMPLRALYLSLALSHSLALLLSLAHSLARSLSLALSLALSLSLSLSNSRSLSLCPLAPPHPLFRYRVNAKQHTLPVWCRRWRDFLHTGQYATTWHQLKAQLQGAPRTPTANGNAPLRAQPAGSIPLAICIQCKLPVLVVTSLQPRTQMRQIGISRSRGGRPCARGGLYE